MSKVEYNFQKIVSEVTAHHPSYNSLPTDQRGEVLKAIAIVLEAAVTRFPRLKSTTWKRAYEALSRQKPPESNLVTNAIKTASILDKRKKHPGFFVRDCFREGFFMIQLGVDNHRDYLDKQRLLSGSSLGDFRGKVRLSSSERSPQ